MSIHDVDVHSADRSSPEPNTGAAKIQPGFRMNLGTAAVQYNGGAVTSTPGFINSKDARTLVNDGSNDRVILGRQADNSYGLIVSKPGFDADPSSPDNLIFNSDQDAFKIALAGEHVMSTYSIAGTSGEWIKSGNSSPDTIVHNLGFIPAVLCFVDFGGQYTLMPATFTQVGSTAAIYWEHVFANVDATNLYLGSQTYSFGAASATGGSYSIKYYLLQETAN